MNQAEKAGELTRNCRIVGGLSGAEVQLRLGDSGDRPCGEIHHHAIFCGQVAENR